MCTANNRRHSEVSIYKQTELANTETGAIQEHGWKHPGISGDLVKAELRVNSLDRVNVVIEKLTSCSSKIDDLDITISNHHDMIAISVLNEGI
jgi:hypothetical protein